MLTHWWKQVWEQKIAFKKCMDRERGFDRLYLMKGGFMGSVTACYRWRRGQKAKKKALRVSEQPQGERKSPKEKTLAEVAYDTITQLCIICLWT